MDRYTAINLITDALKQINKADSYNNDVHDSVYDVAMFIEDINSFPTISVHCISEQIMHSLSDERYSVIAIEIRGYTLDEAVEEAGELLASDIERALSNTGIDDLKIMTVETDGGLASPMGVCIIRAGVFIRR
jgi:hypothetical protein